MAKLLIFTVFFWGSFAFGNTVNISCSQSSLHSRCGNLGDTSSFQIQFHQADSNMHPTDPNSTAYPPSSMINATAGHEFQILISGPQQSTSSADDRDDPFGFESSHTTIQNVLFYYKPTPLGHTSELQNVYVSITVNGLMHQFDVPINALQAKSYTYESVSFEKWSFQPGTHTIQRFVCPGPEGVPNTYESCSVTVQ